MFLCKSQKCFKTKQRSRDQIHLTNMSCSVSEMCVQQLADQICACLEHLAIRRLEANQKPGYGPAGGIV